MSSFSKNLLIALLVENLTGFTSENSCIIFRTIFPFSTFPLSKQTFEEFSTNTLVFLSFIVLLYSYLKYNTSFTPLYSLHLLPCPSIPSQIHALLLLSLCTYTRPHIHECIHKRRLLSDLVLLMCIF